MPKPSPQDELDRITAAFRATPREDFVLPIMRGQAHLDQPLPIGDGQTISQPSTVRMMLEWLDVQPGDKIMDVGSGSGWTTALLAYLTGHNGQVWAVEKVPELVDFGRANLKRVGVKNARISLAGPVVGLPDQSPFDRILVSASASALPQELLSQLKIGGKLVIPVSYDILEITKTASKEHQAIRHPGFSFVPLV